MSVNKALSNELERQNTKSFHHPQQYLSYTKMHAFVTFVGTARKEVKSQVYSQKEKARHRLLKSTCQNLNKLINVLILLAVHPSYPLTDEQTVR